VLYLAIKNVLKRRRGESSKVDTQEKWQRGKKLRGLKYLGYNTWKCHKETLCVATLNKQKLLFFFSDTVDRKGKQVLFGHWCQWEEGGHKERVRQGEYDGILCTHE
jgi:hypothetical protein